MHRFTLGVVVLAAVTALPLEAQQGPTAAPRAGAAAAGRAAPARTNVPAVLPGTPETAFTTIQGNALDSSSQSLPSYPVRLRDVRFGRIVDSQITDQSGLFTFRAVDPGNYVVELMSTTDNAVLAASQVLNVNAGEAVSAVVKLPFRLPPFGGLLGHNAAQAVTIASAAALTGVLAEVATVEVSPERLP